MGFDVFIPARFGSTRLPGKPLLQAGGKPLIQWVYEQAGKSSAERVVVATDDRRIAEACQVFGAEVCMTREDHRSGTDRIHEAATRLGLDSNRIVVNLQGDEPLIPPELLDRVAGLMVDDQELDIATAAHAIREGAELDDPNVVKVVVNRRNHALYFSRARIPFDRAGLGVPCYRHIGLYAYRVGYLDAFTRHPPSTLEKAESLEQLRTLEHGGSIGVHLTDLSPGPGIDTEEDLRRFEASLGS